MQRDAVSATAQTSLPRENVREPTFPSYTSNSMPWLSGMSSL